MLQRDVPLSEIAAITFTEAAASELQARIRVQFEKRAATEDSALGARAAQAIADADLAAISTVHGFASRILSEFSVAAGLPPRVTVLDEVASQLANEQRWERFVDLLHEEPEYDELMYRAALIEVPLSPRYHGQASFKDVAAQLRAELGSPRRAARSADRWRPSTDRLHRIRQRRRAACGGAV